MLEPDYVHGLVGGRRWRAGMMAALARWCWGLFWRQLQRASGARRCWSQKARSDDQLMEPVLPPQLSSSGCDRGPVARPAWGRVQPAFSATGVGYEKVRSRLETLAWADLVIGGSRWLARDLEG